MMSNYSDLSNLDSLSPAVIITMIVASVVLIAIAYTILILFILTLQKNLKSISEVNRKMTTGQLWLNLIPVFSMVWMFITVTRLKESNELEFKDKNISYQGTFGYNVGIAYCVLNALGVIPYVNSCTSIAALVCFIIYWVEIHKLTGLLQASQQPAQTV